MLLAGDEASLYLQASLMRVWAPIGQTPVVKAAPGRDHTHFYGALNLLTGQEVTLRSDLMNAEVSALSLERLLLAYPDTPLLLLWDRAPWHRGPAIRAVLEANPRLAIIWFPPGSAELNPQEHVWKATRQAVSHNHDVPNLPALANQFAAHLTQTTFPTTLLQRYGFHSICSIFKC